MIIDKIKAYGFQALSLVLFILLATQTFRLHSAEREADKATTALASERALASAALATSEKEARGTEGELNTSAAETRKETKNEINTFSSQYAALLKRVRIAEANLATERLMSKAASTTSHGSGTKGDPGTELLSTIGEEDVSEAKRGDELRTYLKACYRDYENARQALMK